MATSTIHKHIIQDNITQNYSIEPLGSVTISMPFRTLWLIGCSGNAMDGVALVNSRNSDIYIDYITNQHGWSLSSSGLNLTITSANTTYYGTVHIIPIWTHITA